MIPFEIIFDLCQDAFFAALAALGFAAISNPPKSSYKFCMLIAATGHVARYCFLNFFGWNLAVASMLGAFVIGLLAIIIAPKVKCPPETFSFPSLLPMIPGIYAYRSIQGLVMSITAKGEDDFQHWFYLCESNLIICILVILGMVIGQMIPILAFKRISFTTTKT